MKTKNRSSIGRIKILVTTLMFVFLIGGVLAFDTYINNTNIFVGSGLGVGTQNPNQTLHVNGSFSVYNTTGILGLFQNVNGRVGIGTPTPSVSLDVNGTVRIFSANTHLRFANSTQSNLWHMELTSNGALDFVESGVVGGRLRLHKGGNVSINNSNFFVDALNGRVGIGTNTPSGKLNVIGLTNTTNIYAGSGESRFWSGNYSDPHSGATYAIKVGSGGIAVNNDSLFMGSVGIGTTNFSEILSVNGTFSVRNATGGLGLFQSTSGNVGIGTTSPESKLSIEMGSGGNGRAFGIREATEDNFYINANFSGTGETGNWIEMRDWQHDTIMTWRGDNRVGIGTTSPNALFTVQDSGATQNPFGRTANFMHDTLANTEAVIGISTDDSGSAGEYFIRARTNEDSGADDEFLLRTNGDAAADGSWNGGGADYAEWFIAEELVPESSLVGLNLKTGKVRVWREYDPLIGVQSVNPGFVGNNIQAENTNEDMLAEGYALVGLVGQLSIRSPIFEKDGRIYTPDGEQFIGYRLTDGKVFLNINRGAIQELKEENEAMKIALCELGKEEFC